MEYCSGGDLTNYIKKRGRVEGLEYVASPGMAPQYYPHPRTGGLDEIVVRSFLRQLGERARELQLPSLTPPQRARSSSSGSGTSCTGTSSRRTCC